MRSDADSSSRRWVVAGVVAALAGVLLLALFGPPARPGSAPAAPGSKPSIVLVPNLGDEAALFDPSPLFLPTGRNGLPRAPAAPEPGAAFPGYQVSLPESVVRPALGQPIRVPAGPAQALFTAPPGNPALGIGRVEARGRVTHLSLRESFVDVSELADGRRVYSGPIRNAQPPQRFGPDRRPIEYVAWVDAAGLVGAPVPSTSSGSEALDAYFADYLARTLRIGERLPPGVYRICVGP